MTPGNHRRRNPLTGRWVLVSSGRLGRPWQGERAALEPAGPAFDPNCYLCPGNIRAGGQHNPDYGSTFVFDNDFAALAPAAPTGTVADPLFASEPASGTCRVVCFSPDHSLTLPQLSLEALGSVVDCWCNESADLGARYASVQVFENKGAMMGCSNPHPHGQIWASAHIPDEVAIEDAMQRGYLAANGRPLLADAAEREALARDRVVVETGRWLAVVPFWATWPFETLLLPKFAVHRLPDLAPADRQDLALALKQLTTRYDNLFETSFPYTMGWHGAPFGTEDTAHWRLHAHFYPPLLRSATVRKFMVGYELLAEAQRDLTPEQAAERLRAVGDVHYLEAAA
jgi:UDPglucose--hexose-1-phosphate uridylyltransferase